MQDSSTSAPRDEAIPVVVLFDPDKEVVEIRRQESTSERSTLLKWCRVPVGAVEGNELTDTLFMVF